MTLITVSNDKSKKEDSNNFENSYTYMYFDFNLRYNLKQIWLFIKTINYNLKSWIICQ